MVRKKLFEVFLTDRGDTFRFECNICNSIFSMPAEMNNMISFRKFALDHAKTHFNIGRRNEARADQ